MTSSRLALALAALSATMPLGATAAAQVTAEQTVMREVVEVDATGREVVRLEAADQVTPGEKIAYLLRYRNEGANAAEALSLVMPVPAEVALVGGSAAGEGEMAYSVDGGQAWGALGALTVEEDGGRRAATPADVTHIRWLVASLPQGGKGEVSYRAVLR